MTIGMLYKYAQLMQKDTTKKRLREEDWGLDDWEPNWSNNYRQDPAHYEQNTSVFPKFINGKFVVGYYIVKNVPESTLNNSNIPVRPNKGGFVVDEAELIILKLAGVFYVNTDR